MSSQSFSFLKRLLLHWEAFIGICYSTRCSVQGLPTSLQICDVMGYSSLSQIPSHEASIPGLNKPLCGMFCLFFFHNQHHIYVSWSWICVCIKCIFFQTLSIPFVAVYLNLYLYPAIIM